ncbi:Ecdysoneless -like protein [Brachionus plicatilis]|uniref:Ecdysoneless-like protein n=1 Tax=Brachionus plicatilis TaxID=10195 RepID=A0A3M7SNW3_BRAPC|nr:Ecdysoneless -like protein [Brachionus plicatilis]
MTDSFSNKESQSQQTTNKNGLKPERLENLDDTQVEFKIFVSTTKNNQKIDSLYEKMLDYVEGLTSSYIWNNEKFYLNRPISTLCQPEYLHSIEQSPIDYTCYGCVDFGDNLKDEWYIVYLLHKLTSEFDGQIAAQVNDSDGEFLLIHSADHLPDWASSAADNCMHNRVFIYNGQLHIIPPATSPAQITYMPAFGSIKNSLHGAKCVFDFPSVTRAGHLVQECVQKQIGAFEPELLAKNLFHRATCLIPAKLAWLLKNNPGLISSAINRFCEKDPKDLKLCNTLSMFKPVDLVNYRVQFTKHLYGKLKYVEYRPERRQNWPNFAHTANPNEQLLNSLNKERSILGHKLTCAFEVISKQLVNDPLGDKCSFEAYVRRLKNVGYFKDLLENSKSYNELMQKAKENYENDGSHFESDKKQLDKLVDSFYLDNIINEDYVVKIKEEISNVQEKETDDSDEWLCVEAPQLDDYLEMYARGDVGSTYDFRIISNAFKNFIHKPSKKKENLLDGVEYKSIEKDKGEKLIDFNVDSMQDNLNEILKMKSDEEKSDDGDETDSFYEIGDDALEDQHLDEDEPSLQNYMDSMDSELREVKNLSRSTKSDDLDIDLNLVSNALESYSSQLGLSGPVSNILKSLGL